MTYSFNVRPAARQDILAIAEFLEVASGDPLLADRWTSAVKASSAYAAQYPDQTPVIDFIPITEFGPLRRRISDRPFNRYLLFYRFNNEQVTITRVLHGARNWAGLPDL
jgi:plasmid stabilization system protein ParE